MNADTKASIYQEYDGEDTQGNDLVEWLEDYHADELSALISGYPDKSTFVVDWQQLWRFDADLADDVKANPELREVFAWAVEEAVQNTPTATHDDFDGNDSETDFHVMFANVGQPKDVAQLIQGDEESELVTLRGQVAKASDVKPKVTEAALVCENSSCGAMQLIPQPEHGTSVPKVCGVGDCRGSSFALDFGESKTKYHQLVRVKEPPESEGEDNHIDVHLTRDMAGAVNAGERVDITGVLKAHVEDFRESGIPEFYMEGEGITKHESDYDAIDTSKYADEIKAIASGERGNPYQLLIDSFAHSLQGGEKLETLKLALVLQLFGGWRRPYGDGRYARGDMHIALIGDPGTGKSSLLDAAEDISPRSTFVSGKNTSKAGMTAAAVRDDFGDTEWSLEAGAIVKAHRGIACVDEIDKVNPDVVSSLHTALEKQRLEVSKAGINATLKCETSLLAAGNPSEGRFIEEVDRIQQLNLPPALRSRFDLIYCLTDVPDWDHDMALAEHMTELRSESGRIARTNSEDELEEKAPVDRQTLRAYIAYAREHSHPIAADDEVKQRIAQQYAEWRDSDSGLAGLTPRLVDATNRIAEASARVRLDDTVRMEDVERAESVITLFLSDIGILTEDGVNAQAADLLESGTSAEERLEAKDVPGIIKTLQPDETSFVDVETVVETASEAGYNEQDVRARIENMADGSVGKQMVIYDRAEDKVRMV
jgi:replicative DNA helicase Mcm